MPRGLPVVVALVTLAGGVTGCGPPPELTRPSPPPPLPSPTSTSPTPSPSAAEPSPPSPSPSATGFAEQVAVPCDGSPGGEAIVALLTREGVLPAGTRPRVTEGPLCAGEWQYAVVTVADRDPLQVVTEGRPGSLTLVAAGTHVCTAAVRVTAPPGIRTAAGCVG